MPRNPVMPAALCSFILLARLSPVFAGDLETKGKIDEVTVYQDQALVTRVIEAPGPAGLREILVTDLPEQVQAGSIYAEADAGAEVRSVSFRARPLEKDMREDVRKLDDQIRATGDKIAGAEARIKVLQEQRAYLTSLQGFVAPTATTEMTKGVLNAETIQKVTQFQFEQRTKLAADELESAQAIRGFKEQLAVLQNQRNQLTNSAARQSREAVVFVNVTKPGAVVRLRYLVLGASWSPSYNIVAAAKQDVIKVEYMASVQQMSGEEWPAVKMTLSTALPNLIAMAPRFSKLELILTGADQGVQSEQLSYATIKQEAAARRSNEWKDNANSTATLWTTVKGDWKGNQVWGDNHAEFVQTNELFRRVRIEPTKNAPVKEDNEGMVVAYKLDNRMTLPSRRDQQLIQIAAFPLKAEFYKLASPLLSPYVYDEASINNNSAIVMLQGRYSSYVAGQFMGQGVLPSVAIGETFTVGLGIDASLRTSRDLIDKTEAVQGGNRITDFTYRLAIENFGDKPAKVRLMDRIPVAKEGDIKITLTKPGMELFKDPNAQPQDQKRGILRWDVESPANAVGAKATSFDFQYRIEHDKQMKLVKPAQPNAPGKAPFEFN